MSVVVGAPMPAALAEAWVLDGRGGSHLRELVAGRPAVLVFLRHFGCVACSEHITLLAPQLHELTRLGVAVVYIGNGTPNFIEGFVDRNAIDANKQSTMEGDHYQQGGVLVTDRDGCVVYAHADRATGDHAPLPDVIEAAMRVAVQDAMVV